MTRDNTAISVCGRAHSTMLVSLRCADHYGDARRCACAIAAVLATSSSPRHELHDSHLAPCLPCAPTSAEESLRIAPCLLKDCVLPGSSCNDGLDTLLCPSAPPLPPTPFFAPFGPVPALNELQATLSSAVMMSAMDKAKAISDGGAASRLPDDDSDEDEDDDERETCVIEKMLARDQQPKLGLRQFEQRLQHDPTPPPSAAALLLDALGAARPPAPWPPEVHAKREALFRPHLMPPRPALSEAPQTEQQQRRSMASRGLGGLGGLSRRLCRAASASIAAAASSAQDAALPGSEGGAPAAAAQLVVLGMEAMLQPREPPAVAVDVAFAEDIELLLRPSAGAADALAAPPDTAKALAPLGSARQRSERTQRLLTVAMAPLGEAPKQPRDDAWPRCLRLPSAPRRSEDARRELASSLLGELREIECVLQVEPIARADADLACPIHRFLNPRTAREPTRKHPASGIDPDVLKIHEVCSRLSICAHVWAYCLVFLATAF